MGRYFMLRIRGNIQRACKVCKNIYTDTKTDYFTLLELHMRGKKGEGKQRKNKWKKKQTREKKHNK